MQSHWATTEWFKLCSEIWKTVKYQCPAEMSDTVIRPPWYCSWILMSWLSACVFVLSLDSMKYSLCMLKWKSSSVVKFGNPNLSGCFRPHFLSQFSGTYTIWYVYDDVYYLLYYLVLHTGAGVGSDRWNSYFTLCLTPLSSSDVNSTDRTKLAIISCNMTYMIVYGNILLIVLLLNDLQSINENTSTISQRWMTAGNHT